jgi:hypothetical protein
LRTTISSKPVLLVAEVDLDQSLVGAGLLGDAIDACAGQAVLLELVA